MNNQRIIQIKFQASHLELTPLAAKALIEYAGKDETRAHLYGVAIYTIDRTNADGTTNIDTYVCATDGHALVMFDACVSVEAHDRMVTRAYDRRVWPLSYVINQAKVAAVFKTNVRLEYSALSAVQCPPFSQGVPKDGNKTNGELPCFSTRLLARIDKVGRACCEGSKANHVAQCKYLGAALDPIKFRIECGTTGLGATVVQMPVRV